jgi:hypothetical protein
MVVGYRKDLNAGQRPAVEYGVKAGSRSTSARCWWSRFRPVLIDNSARVGRAMQIACTPNIGLAGSLRHQRIIADRTKDNFPPDISVALGGVRIGPPSCLVDGIDCFVSSKQRAAVEHGIKPGKTNDIGPLLVIAGASWLRLIPTHHFRYP